MNSVEKVVRDIFILNQFGNWDSNSFKSHELFYLYQITADELGFRHKWYGFPFSEAAAEIIFDYSSNKKHHDNIINNTRFTEDGKKRFVKVKDLVNPPSEVSEDKWVEMLSSMHYFKNICYHTSKIPLTLTNTFLYLDENRQNITKKDHSRKFSLGEFKFGWKRLKEFDLLDKKCNRVV